MRLLVHCPWSAFTLFKCFFSESVSILLAWDYFQSNFLGTQVIFFKTTLKPLGDKRIVKVFTLVQLSVSLFNSNSCSFCILTIKVRPWNLWKRKWKHILPFTNEKLNSWALLRSVHSGVLQIQPFVSYNGNCTICTTQEIHRHVLVYWNLRTERNTHNKTNSLIQNLLILGSQPLNQACWFVIVCLDWTWKTS